MGLAFGGSFNLTYEDTHTYIHTYKKVREVKRKCGLQISSNAFKHQIAEFCRDTVLVVCIR